METVKINESHIRKAINESISELQTIEKINKFIKTNIGNHVDSVEEDLWYELGIKCYRWGESRLRGHILRLIAVKGTDIWIELLYGLKTDEWGYSYELIDGIAAEDGSTAFKEFKRKYFFPNGRKPNARKPAADVVAEEGIHIKDENKGKFFCELEEFQREPCPNPDAYTFKFF